MPTKIVVADDESHITHVVSLKLTNAGYEVIIAHDGEEALELCREHTPALVITDMQMPYMSGLELAQHLKQEDATSATPVLMLTARGYALDQDELAQTNIRKVMSKPFSPREVLEIVQGYVGNETGEREAA